MGYPHPLFDRAELQTLAEFVCGRVDDLREIVEDPNPRIDKGFRDGAKVAAGQLTSLDEKLRPYYKKKR